MRTSIPPQRERINAPASGAGTSLSLGFPQTVFVVAHDMPHKIMFYILVGRKRDAVIVTRAVTHYVFVKSLTFYVYRVFTEVSAPRQ